MLSSFIIQNPGHTNTLPSVKTPAARPSGRGGELARGSYRDFGGTGTGESITGVAHLAGNSVHCVAGNGIVIQVRRVGKARDNGCWGRAASASTTAINQRKGRKHASHT